MEPGASYQYPIALEIKKSGLIHSILVEVSFSYREGESIHLAKCVFVGILPTPGTALLVISDEGLVGIITINAKKLSALKTGVQLKIGEGASIAWSPVLRCYVAVGGNTYIARSHNAILWDYVENPSLKGLSKVIWNDDLAHYIAIGQHAAVLISLNGKEWQISDTKSESNLNDIIWCRSMRHYVVIGDDGTIAVSPNAIDWEIQPSPVKSNLIGIASNSPWKEKVQYVVITAADEVLVSADGKEWKISLTQKQSNAMYLKDLRTVYYDSHYNTPFFAIISGARNAYGSLYRAYRYDYGDGNISSYWTVDVIYMQNYGQAKISDFKRMIWCEAMQSYVAVAEKPGVLFPIPYYTYIFNAVEVDEDFSKLCQKGFSDVTTGLISEFKEDENTVYYNLSESS